MISNSSQLEQTNVFSYSVSKENFFRLVFAIAVSGMFSHGHDIMPIQRLQHATAAITLTLLLLTCMAAFPALHHLHHNAFAS